MSDEKENEGEPDSSDSSFVTDEKARVAETSEDDPRNNESNDDE